MGEEAHMDDLHVLTDAVGRGWKTSEFTLVVAAAIAILALAPHPGVAIAVALMVAAFCLSRARVKAATSAALLADVPPPIKLGAADPPSVRPIRP